MMKKRIISICLAVSLLAMTGCGSAETTNAEIIELKEPVDGGNGWLTETVTRRNIYLGNVYEASVYPEVQEYAYETRQNFEAYGAMLGDEVSVGELLIKASTESIDSQIERMEERLESLTESYQKYKKGADEKIADMTGYVAYYEKIFENLEDQEPEQYFYGTDGTRTVNPEYSKWEKEWNSWLVQSDKNDYDLEVTQENLRQKEEVYNLDYAYYSTQLKELKAKVKLSEIKSGIAGEVVAIGMFYPEESMMADDAVVAVGDMGKLCLKCEYIPARNIVYYAKEYYAVVNGKRYEVVYDEMGDKSCTTFYFADENPDVESGDFATIVLENNSRDQVIAVKKSAVYVDSGGHYVYVVENDETIQRPVKIGVSDGFYTEIKSGLKEGEEVLVSEEVEVKNTYVLEKGTFAKNYTRNGELYYPINFWMNASSIEYGTIFFQEYLVEKYQYVEAGQPIVSVRVEGDMVELARLENDLKRAKERLADLKAKVTEENAESYAERIEAEQEAIDEQEEKVNKMKEDYMTVEICAERAGLVTSMDTSLAKEQVIGSNTNLVWMKDPTYGFLALEGGENLRYGNELDITYTNASRQTVNAQATIVSMAVPGVSANLDDGYKYAKVSDTVLNDIVEVMRKQTGRFVISKLKATGTVSAMNNVVLVPKKAVKTKDGVTYVNVVQEDGSALPISFLAGGSDGQNYWVVEGLTEGMTICWE